MYRTVAIHECVFSLCMTYVPMRMLVLTVPDVVVVVVVVRTDAISFHRHLPPPSLPAVQAAPDSTPPYPRASRGPMAAVSPRSSVPPPTRVYARHLSAAGRAAASQEHLRAKTLTQELPSTLRRHSITPIVYHRIQRASHQKVSEQMKSQRDDLEAADTRLAICKLISVATTYRWPRTYEVVCALRREDELVVAIGCTFDIRAEAAIPDLVACIILDFTLRLRQPALQVGQ